MYSNHYIEKSLELHLFFGRIMKEHALFLQAGFTPADPAFSKRAAWFLREFEHLLSRAVRLADGMVSPKVLRSGEIVTDFTALAETQTEHFTGIPIDRRITGRELALTAENAENPRDAAGDRGRGISGNPGSRGLTADAGRCGNTDRQSEVRQLNQTALRLLDGLITFKESILDHVLACRMFTMNYPLLIEHILREARLYRQYVETLECEGDLNGQSMREIECFWNRIMMEHAQFIRGLLDPSETALCDSADRFSREYAKLLEQSCRAQSRAMTADSLSETRRFKDFKTAGVRGISGCEIRSVILPLLADHVLREANHYIRLLES